MLIVAVWWAVLIVPSIRTLAETGLLLPLAVNSAFTLPRRCTIADRPAGRTPMTPVQTPVLATVKLNWPVLRTPACNCTVSTGSPDRARATNGAYSGVGPLDPLRAAASPPAAAAAVMALIADVITARRG